MALWMTSRMECESDWTRCVGTSEGGQDNSDLLVDRERNTSIHGSNFSPKPMVNSYVSLGTSSTSRVRQCDRKAPGGITCDEVKDWVGAGRFVCREQTVK
jgi:hypothetical protein